jgi:hypothetical protein
MTLEAEAMTLEAGAIALGGVCSKTLAPRARGGHRLFLTFSQPRSNPDIGGPAQFSLQTPSRRNPPG